MPEPISDLSRDRTCPDPGPDLTRMLSRLCQKKYGEGGGTQKISLRYPRPPSAAAAACFCTNGAKLDVAGEYASNSPASMSKYHPCSASVPASTRSLIQGNDRRLSSDSAI